MKWIVVSLAKVLISSKHLQLSMPGWNRHLLPDSNILNLLCTLTSSIGELKLFILPST